MVLAIRQPKKVEEVVSLRGRIQIVLLPLSLAERRGCLQRQGLEDSLPSLSLSLLHVNSPSLSR